MSTFEQIYITDHLIPTWPVKRVTQYCQTNFIVWPLHYMLKHFHMPICSNVLLYQSKGPPLMNVAFEYVLYIRMLNFNRSNVFLGRNSFMQKKFHSNSFLQIHPKRYFLGCHYEFGPKLNFGILLLGWNFFIQKYILGWNLYFFRQKNSFQKTNFERELCLGRQKSIEFSAENYFYYIYI